MLIASHTAKFEPLFELGLPASEELVAVAEDAVLDPLRNALMGDPGVLDVETLVGAGGTVILPGESASIVVATPGKIRFLVHPVEWVISIRRCTTGEIPLRRSR